MKQTSSPCGRPAGRKKTAKIEVVLEPAVKEEFMKKIAEEGKTASVEIGSWIRRYIRETQAPEGEGTR